MRTSVFPLVAAVVLACGTVSAQAPPPKAAPVGGAADKAQTAFLYAAKPPTLPEIAAIMQARADAGWEYLGETDVQPTDPGKLPKGTEVEGLTKNTRKVLLFRKASVRVVEKILVRETITLKYGETDEVVRTLQYVFGQRQFATPVKGEKRSISLTGSPAAVEAAKHLLKVVFVPAELMPDKKAPEDRRDNMLKLTEKEIEWATFVVDSASPQETADVVTRLFKTLEAYPKCRATAVERTVLVYGPPLAHRIAKDLIEVLDGKPFEEPPVLGPIH